MNLARAWQGLELVAWTFKGLECLMFCFFQYAHALSTADGYTGYGPEQGNKVP